MVFLLMHRARRYDQAQARQAQRRAQKRLARTNGSFRGDGRPTTRHFGTSTLHAPGLLATFQLSDPRTKWVDVSFDALEAGDTVEGLFDFV